MSTLDSASTGSTVSLGERLGRPLLLAVALSPVVFTLYWLTTFEWSDNGLFLFAGEAVRRGEVPYRDFSWHYLPGGPYLVAAIQAIFGPTYVPVRAFFIAAVLATLVLSLRVIRALAGRLDARLAFLALPACISWRPVLNHATLEPLAGVATVLLGFRALERRTRAAYLAAGVPTALLVLFSHLAGALLGLGIFFGMLLAELLPQREPERPRMPFGRLVGSLLLMAVPSVVVLGLVILVGAIRGGNAEMLDWTVLRLLRNYVATNAQTHILDFSPQRAMASFGGVVGGRMAGLMRAVRIFGHAIAMRLLPFVAMAFFAGWVSRRLLGRPAGAEPGATAGIGPLQARRFTLAFSVGAFLYLDAFKGWKQAANDTAALLLVLSFYAAAVELFGRGRAWLRQAVLLAGAAVSLLALSFFPGQALEVWRTRSTMPLVQTQLGALRSPTLASALFRQELLTALRRAAPGEPARTRTLFTFYYEPSLYPATGLLPVSYHRYFTLTLSGPPELEAACRDIQRGQPDVIVRDNDWDTRPQVPFRKNVLETCFLPDYEEAPPVRSQDGSSYRIFYRRPPSR